MRGLLEEIKQNCKFVCVHVRRWQVKNEASITEIRKLVRRSIKRHQSGGGGMDGWLETNKYSFKVSLDDQMMM